MLHDFNKYNFADTFVERLWNSRNQSSLTFSYLLQAIERVLDAANGEVPDSILHNNKGDNYLRYDAMRNIKDKMGRLISDKDLVDPKQFLKTFPAKLSAGLNAADTLTLTEPATGATSKEQLRNARETAKSYLRSMARAISKVQPGLQEALAGRGIDLQSKKGK